MILLQSLAVISRAALFNHRQHPTGSDQDREMGWCSCFQRRRQHGHYKHLPLLELIFQLERTEAFCHGDQLELEMSCHGGQSDHPLHVPLHSPQLVPVHLVASIY